LVWSNLVGVGVVLDDSTSQQNDVTREVGNKGDAMHAQKMCPEEHIEGRAQEGGNAVAGAGEVRGDRFLVMMFVGIQKDLAKGG
jgi:hypothetical protein